MSTCCPVFNTNRQVQEYMEKEYSPSADRFAKLTSDKLQRAVNLANWRQRVLRGWSGVRVENVDADSLDPMRVGSKVEVRAKINLGGLTADDVEVQLYHGVVDNLGEIAKPASDAMSTNGTPPQGTSFQFKGNIQPCASGNYGYAIRVMPKHPDLQNVYETGLIAWG